MRILVSSPHLSLQATIASIVPRPNRRWQAAGKQSGCSLTIGRDCPGTVRLLRLANHFQLSDLWAQQPSGQKSVTEMANAGGSRPTALRGFGYGGPSGAKDRIPTRVLLALSSPEASPPALATPAEQRAPRTLLKIDARFPVFSSSCLCQTVFFAGKVSISRSRSQSAAFASGRRRLTAFCQHSRHKQRRRQVKLGNLAKQVELRTRFLLCPGPTCVGDTSPELYSVSGACSPALRAPRSPSKRCSG